MSINLNYKIILIITIMLMWKLDSFADTLRPLHAENSDFKIALSEVKDCDKCPYRIFWFNKLNKKEGKESPLVLNIASHKINDLKVYKNKLIINGDLNFGGDIVTIVDLKSNQVIDTFWGYNLQFSSDNRYAVFVEHYPRSYQENTYIKKIIDIYDFNNEPGANRLDSKFIASKRYVGIPIYPEAYARSKSQDFFINDRREENEITSLLYWFDNNTKIIFTEWYIDSNYLISIDIARGTNNAETVRKKIDSSTSADITNRLKEKMVIKSIKKENDDIVIETLTNHAEIRTHNKIKMKSIN